MKNNLAVESNNINYPLKDRYWKESVCRHFFLNNKIKIT